MAHAVPPPGSGRSWHWHQTLGVVLVVIGLVVGVIAVVALNRPSGKASQGTTVAITGSGAPPPPVSASGSATPSTSKSSSTTSAAPTTTVPARPTVAILNDTTIEGLGARAAADLTAQGWTVTSTTTYSNNIISTCAYYDASDPANQAAALLLQQQFPWIKRVKERFAELPSSPIVLVLTASY